MGAKYIDSRRKNRAPIALRGPKWLQNVDLKIFYRNLRAFYRTLRALYRNLRALYRTPGIV